MTTTLHTLTPSPPSSLLIPFTTPPNRRVLLSDNYHRSNFVSVLRRIGCLPIRSGYVQYDSYVRFYLVDFQP